MSELANNGPQPTHNGGDGYLFAAAAVALDEVEQLWELAVGDGASIPVAHGLRCARVLASEKGSSVGVWRREGKVQVALDGWV